MGDGVVSGDNFVRLADRRVVVDEDMLAALVEVLGQVERGEFVSFCYFGFLRDGSSQTFYSASDDTFRDMALLERLRFRMLRGFEE